MNLKTLESFSAKFITWCMIAVMGFLTVVSLCFRSYIDVTYQETIYYRNDNILVAAVFLLVFFVGPFLPGRLPVAPWHQLSVFFGSESAVEYSPMKRGWVPHPWPMLPPRCPILVTRG